MTPAASAAVHQRFGAHLSIAGGIHKALVSAEDLGCDCLQVFVKNQQQWSAPPRDPGEIERWRRTWRRSRLRPVVAHATYLINLASPDRDLWRRSVEAFAEEILRCAALRIGELVIHPGSHRGAGIAAGLDRVVEAINRCCERTADTRVRVLLETTSGQGHSVGSRFEELGEILDRVALPRRLGVCLDTCHVFAAGYELRTSDGYAQTLAELARHVGLRRVRCLHVNDSKTPLGSKVDRHEHIGRGKLGLRAFRHLVNDRRLARVPRILETPKGQDARGRDLDRVNLARLRKLVAVV